MKRLILTSFLFSIGGLIFAQTIRVANNNPSAPAGPNVFATLQAAIDAAQPGDIIQVVPSQTNYGSGVIDKQLVVQGVGFNPSTPFIMKSRVAKITLQSANASGTRISGIVFTSLTSVVLAADTGTPYTLSNIVVENCFATTIIQPLGTNSLANLTISGCIIGSAIGSTSKIALELRASGGATTNVVISNNVLYNANWIFPTGSINAGNNTLITNNIFVGFTSDDQTAFSNLINCIVTNNIFYGTAPFSAGSATNELNVYTNNISYNTSDDTLPPSGNGVGNTGSGNLQGFDPLIVSVPFSTSWDFDNDLTLGVGSPALGAGTDGTDIGPSGFTIPFSATGTSIPTILQLNTSSLVNQGENLQVTVQAQSNE